MLVYVFNAKQKCKATTVHLSYVNKTSDLVHLADKTKTEHIMAAAQ
jgi:hypothetical protein